MWPGVSSARFSSVRYTADSRIAGGVCGGRERRVWMRHARAQTLTPAPFGERRDQAQHPARQRAAKNLEPGAAALHLADATARPAAARARAPGGEVAGGAFGFPADVNTLLPRSSAHPQAAKRQGKPKWPAALRLRSLIFPLSKGACPREAGDWRGALSDRDHFFRAAFQRSARGIFTTSARRLAPELFLFALPPCGLLERDCAQGTAWRRASPSSCSR